MKRKTDTMTLPTQEPGYNWGPINLIKKIARSIIDDPNQILGINYAFAGVLTMVGLLSIAKKRVGAATTTTVQFAADKLHLGFVGRINTPTGNVPIVGYTDGAQNILFAKMVSFFYNLVLAIAHLAGVDWNGYLNLVSPQIKGVAVIFGGKAIDIELPPMAGNFTVSLRAGRYLDIAEIGTNKVLTCDVIAYITGEGDKEWKTTLELAADVEITNLGTPTGPTNDAYFVTTATSIELVATDDKGNLVLAAAMSQSYDGLPDTVKNYAFNGPSIGGNSFSFQIVDETGATVVVLDATELEDTKLAVAFKLLTTVDYRRDPLALLTTVTGGTRKFEAKGDERPAPEA